MYASRLNAGMLIGTDQIALRRQWYLVFDKSLGLYSYIVCISAVYGECSFLEYQMIGGKRASI